MKQPKALCELQGYVYDAKTRMAEVFQVLGDDARAQALLANKVIRGIFDAIERFDAYQPPEVFAGGIAKGLSTFPSSTAEERTFRRHGPPAASST